MINLGAHLSIAGGKDMACLRARELGCDVLQIFTKNQRRWDETKLTSNEICKFRTARRLAGIRIAFAHNSYLPNLATSYKELWLRSYKAFLDEIKRADLLELSYLVMHPGSAVDKTEKAGLRNIIKAISKAQREAMGGSVMILIETTAGQGKTLGYDFLHLKEIREQSFAPENIGFCFDTCHIFAAGYDIRTKTAYEDTMANFDKLLGADNIKVFHLNDSKRKLGSRIDRHQHIGKGYIGLPAFKFILNDERFINIPKVIETPKENNMDKVNLKILRRLAG
jgi:deoxyribonuclease-4